MHRQMHMQITTTTRPLQGGGGGEESAINIRYLIFASLHLLYLGYGFNCDRGEQKRMLFLEDKWFQGIRGEQW